MVTNPAEVIPKGNKRNLDNGRYYFSKMHNPNKRRDV